MTTMEQHAYEMLVSAEPEVVVRIGKLLDKGYLAHQITRLISNRDVFLAGLVEIAIAHMQETGVRAGVEKVKP